MFRGESSFQQALELRMKPLGAAGMQAVINPAKGFVNIVRDARVSLYRSGEHFSRSRTSVLLLRTLQIHHAQRRTRAMYLSDRQDGRGSAAGLPVLQILPLSEHCETTLNSEEMSCSCRPSCWATRIIVPYSQLPYSLVGADQLACCCDGFLEPCVVFTN